MKSLYQKNELAFSITWIVIYVIAMPIADSLSTLVAIEKVFTVPIAVALASFLLVWIKKVGLSGKYGLIKGTYPTKTYLFFIPLVLILTVNFWCGVFLQYNIVETILYLVSMICVGIIEEIIFRGFLFKALSKDNLAIAFIVSSLTFGVGHIINLIVGANFISTLLQIGYATAAGFLFSVIFYKSGSLLPCIITHSLMNATSIFYYNTDLIMETITSIFLIFISLGYAFWILRISSLESQKNSEDIKMK